MAHFGF